MNDLLDQGINFFNSAHYFEAHEVWEDLWREEKSPVRNFYQGLIHAAVGLLHLFRHNSPGAVSQLSKSLAKLDLYPPDAAGIDVDRLRRDLREVLAQMGVGDAPGVRIVRLKSLNDVVHSDGTS